MNNSQTTVRQQAKHTSSSGSGHQLSSRGVTRAQHHETAGCHRPRRHILKDPTKSWQKHVQQHMPRVLPTGAAKQVQLACGRWRVQNRALALARSRTNVHVSPDHLPPTSPAKTTNSGPGAGSDEFRISAFFPTPSDLQRHAVDVGAWVSSAVTVERAHQCGIDGELHAPKQWETFGDNFQPSAIECLWGQ